MTAQPMACVAPASIADADIAANAAALAAPNLCLSEQRFEENGVNWHLVTIRNTTRSGPLWVVPHDDEDAAFAASLHAVTAHGGAIVAVEAGEDRFVGAVDPNRTFRPAGAAPAACPSAPGGFPRYARAVLAPWNRSFPVIGMHSNADGFGEGRGAGTISIRRADARSQPFAANGSGRLGDEDTLVMIASMAPPEDNPPGMAEIGWFNARGVNVLYNRVAAEIVECTLADYLTLDGIGPYLGIEVEDGDTATARLLADLLMEFIDSSAYAGML
ncbi:MAG: hypothetical protein IT535_05075 [Bauldia sp.]|nr:hypothetical protein [Bauldia sp.]